MDTIDNRENLLKRLAGPIQVNILTYNDFQKKVLLAFYLFLYVIGNFVANAPFQHGCSFRLTNKNVICKMISSGFSISKFFSVEILISNRA